MNRGLAILLAGLLVAGCTSAATPRPAGSTVAPTATPSRPTPPAASPTPSGAPVSSPASSPSPTGAGLRFEQVATVERTELYAAAAFDGGFVVAGCWLRPPTAADAGCAEARILRSIDGRTWSDAVVVGAVERRVIAITETPLGLLALGSDEVREPPGTRSVWRSADGRRWEPFAMPAPPAIVFTHAFVLGDRTVLVGEDTSYDLAAETEAWATTDGRTWTNGTTPLSWKVATGAGLVAIGDECIDLCPENLPIIVRRSADGLVWTEDAPDPALAGARISPSAAWAGRVVAGGALGEGTSLEAAVWFDEAGGWRAVRLDGGGGYAVTTLMVAGRRLIAVAEAADGLSRQAWWTADGRSWESRELEGVDAAPGAWAGDDSLLFVVDFRSIWLAT